MAAFGLLDHDNISWIVLTNCPLSFRKRSSILALKRIRREAAMPRTACDRLTNSQGSGARPKELEVALSWVRALFPLRGRPARQPDPSPQDAAARDTRLSRADALREAALSLSLGDGIPFTGRDYQLLEQLWRTDP
jgi:hypothetical protein